MPIPCLLSPETAADKSFLKSDVSMPAMKSFAIDPKSEFSASFIASLKAVEVANPASLRAFA